MEPTDKGFKLSTGKEFYANLSILGLGPKREYEDRLGLTYGYDGGVSEDREPNEFAENAPFTPAERREIADYMIALWQEWAALPPEDAVPSGNSSRE